MSQYSNTDRNSASTLLATMAIWSWKSLTACSQKHSVTYTLNMPVPRSICIINIIIYPTVKQNYAKRLQININLHYNPILIYKIWHKTIKLGITIQHSLVNRKPNIFLLAQSKTCIYQVCCHVIYLGSTINDFGVQRSRSNILCNSANTELRQISPVITNNRYQMTSLIISWNLW